MPAPLSRPCRRCGAWRPQPPARRALARRCKCGRSWRARARRRCWATCYRCCCRCGLGWAGLRGSRQGAALWLLEMENEVASQLRLLACCLPARRLRKQRRSAAAAAAKPSAAQLLKRCCSCCWLWQAPQLSRTAHPEEPQPAHRCQPRRSARRMRWRSSCLAWQSACARPCCLLPAAAVPAAARHLPAQWPAAQRLWWPCGHWACSWWHALGMPQWSRCCTAQLRLPAAVTQPPPPSRMPTWPMLTWRLAAAQHCSRRWRSCARSKSVRWAAQQPCQRQRQSPHLPCPGRHSRSSQATCAWSGLQSGCRRVQTGCTSCCRPRCRPCWRTIDRASGQRWCKVG